MRYTTLAGRLTFNSRQMIMQSNFGKDQVWGDWVQTAKIGIKTLKMLNNVGPRTS